MLLWLIHVKICAHSHTCCIYTHAHTHIDSKLFLKKSQILLKEDLVYKNELPSSFLVQLINIFRLTMTLIVPRTLQGHDTDPRRDSRHADTLDCHLFYWWKLMLRNILYICIIITRRVKLQGWQPVQAPKPHSPNRGCSNLCTPSQPITGGRIFPEKTSKKRMQA